MERELRDLGDLDRLLERLLEYVRRYMSDGLSRRPLRGDERERDLFVVIENFFINAFAYKRQHTLIQSNARQIKQSR